MFKNTLTGLSKREKEVFDQVCIHLNSCMTKMGLRDLDGEEDQILIDLWMDTFPYKTNEDGSYVTKTVRQEVWETVDGKYQKVVKEKEVRELDYSKSLIESTSVGIYKWRGEQLLLNKCKYLYGDNRVRKMIGGKAVTEVTVDKWGNERKKAVYEGVDETKVGKRDLSMQVTESALAREGEEPMTIDDVAGSNRSTIECEEQLLLNDLSKVCDAEEMEVIRKFMAGDSANRIYKDFDTNGVKFSPRKMSKLKEKLAGLLRPELSQEAVM